MPYLRFHSLAEQVTDTLREELFKRRWTGLMPGRERLAREWQVSGKTIEVALNTLEREGLLESRGVGKRRKITLPRGDSSQHGLRVGILVGEAGILSRSFHVELRHHLQKAGHSTHYAPKGMLELGMSVSRIARMVKAMEVDAWVVNAGSREVLEWFANQSTPVFALFGRRRGFQIAGTGPKIIPSLRAIMQRLSELGHRRIVFLVRDRQRAPEPSAVCRAYLDELRRLGIEPASYHLPDWEENAGGLGECLRSLFRLTPPTALIADEPALYFAIVQHLMHQGIRVPRDVSLACTDHDPHFHWCKPTVAHISWNSSLVASRVLRWTNHLAQGREDRKLTFIQTRFVDGETLGPALDEGQAIFKTKA